MTLFRSIIITILVSLGFAFGLKNLLGFWETFALSFVVQFIVSFVYRSSKINQVQTLTGDFQQELDQLLSLSETKIVCPCGSYTYTTNLFPNVEETFKCEKCGNDFRVDIGITPTLLTQPIYTEQTVNNIQEVEDIKDEIKITSDYQPGTEL
jgi:transposase-like protein